MPRTLGGRPEGGGTWGGATPAPGSPGSTAPCRPGCPSAPPLPRRRRLPPPPRAPTALQPGTRSEPAAVACALGRPGGLARWGPAGARRHLGKGQPSAGSPGSAEPWRPGFLPPHRPPPPLPRAGPAPMPPVARVPLALEAAVACSSAARPQPHGPSALRGRCQGDRKVARVPPGAVPRIRRTDPALAASCDVDGGSRAVQGPSVRHWRCPKHEPLPPGPLGPSRLPRGSRTPPPPQAPQLLQPARLRHSPRGPHAPGVQGPGSTAGEAPRRREGRGRRAARDRSPRQLGPRVSHLPQL
ncbi:translation initiation factor IF-2-like [Canis lupus familiaris]|uniref:translation initiation factor IF-2-like n=1 Tax=Canis lupus familiaris TaxID=9615 RepID=UPI0018F31932|nr:translation initiation factor IF-2-like [Canis lupus familiaris]